MTTHARSETTCTGGARAGWTGCGRTYLATGRDELGLCPDCKAARQRKIKMQRYREKVAEMGKGQ